LDTIHPPNVVYYCAHNAKYMQSTCLNFTKFQSELNDLWLNFSFDKQIVFALNAILGCITFYMHIMHCESNRNFCYISINSSQEYTKLMYADNVGTVSQNIMDYWNLSCNHTADFYVQQIFEKKGAHWLSWIRVLFFISCSFETHIYFAKE